MTEKEDLEFRGHFHQQADGGIRDLPKPKIKLTTELLQNLSFLDDTTVGKKGNGTALLLQRLFSCMKIGAKVAKDQKEFFFFFSWY